MKSILIRYSFALLVALSSGVFSFFLLPATLYTVYFFLGFFYDPLLIEGNIQLSEVLFVFIPACAATLAYILLLELLLLTRGVSFRKGLEMFLFGAALIFILNIFRIFFLIFVYVEYGKNYFDIIHIFFWQFVSVFFFFAVWIFLVERYHIKNIPVWSDVREILKK